MRSPTAMGLLALGASLLCSCSDDRRVVAAPGSQPGDPTRGFAIAWRLVDVSEASPLTAPALACADAQVAQIQLAAHNGDTSQDFSFSYACDAGRANTPDVTIGNYTIAVDALDAGGASRSRASWPFDNSGGNDLGLVVFRVS